MNLAHALVETKRICSLAMPWQHSPARKWMRVFSKRRGNVVPDTGEDGDRTQLTFWLAFGQRS